MLGFTSQRLVPWLQYFPDPQSFVILQLKYDVALGCGGLKFVEIVEEVVLEAHLQGNAASKGKPKKVQIKSWVAGSQEVMTTDPGWVGWVGIGAGGGGVGWGAIDTGVGIGLGSGHKIKKLHDCDDTEAQHAGT